MADVKHGRRCRRQLAGLGQAASSGRWGVEAFRNDTRDIQDFARRNGRLPEQREGDEIDFRSILHRDGSVLSAPTLSVRPYICNDPEELWYLSSSANIVLLHKELLEAKTRTAIASL